MVSLCLLFLLWNYDLNKSFSLGHNVGLLPPRGHHLQLQPAAECLGICPLVQHDQSGHEGELFPWLTYNIWHITLSQHFAVMEMNLLFTVCVDLGFYFRIPCSLPTVLQPLGRSSQRCWAGSFSLPLNVAWMLISWRWLLTNSLVNPASVFCFSYLSYQKIPWSDIVTNNYRVCFHL